MIPRSNLQSSFSSWLVTRWVSLALPLAFSAVIGLSAPARGDVVVWQTGPFCDECTLTNITFVSVEQFDAFTNSLISNLNYAYNTSSNIIVLVASARSRLYLADSQLIGAQQDISANAGPASAIEQIDSARHYLGTSAPTAFSVARRLNDIEEEAEETISKLDDVKASIYSGAGETRAQVATACESDGECCCQCPDYTSYLQTIIGHLADISQDTVDIRALLESIYYWLCDLYADGSGIGLLPWFTAFGDALSYWTMPGALDGSEQGYEQALRQFAKYVANLATNTWALSTSLYGPLSQPNPFTRSLDSASDPVAHWLLDIGTMWQQLLYDGPANPGGYASGPVSGWRDFALTKNNHPTNSADNALWVRFSDTDSTSVSVSVDGIGDDFYSSLSNLFSRLEIQVNNSLSQPSLHVTIDNTNELTLVDSPGRLYENVVNNSTTINNIASEVTGQQAEYDDPNWTLDDYGSLFDKSAEMRDWDFVGKWSKMFDDVVIEPPGPCKLWDGFAPNSGNDSGTPGPWGGWSQIIDVGSLYWYPMESCGGLIRSIRGVFRALWTIVILFVVAGLVRINWLLARCGVRILIAVVAAFGSPDPMGAVVDVFETVLKALSQLYTGLFGGRPAESD